jgi:acetyl esterase/lipase
MNVPFRSAKARATLNVTDGSNIPDFSCGDHSRTVAKCVFNAHLAPFIFLSIAFATLNPAFGSEIQFTPDIVFGEPAGETLRLNLARPAEDQAAPFPAVICIHGGGFSGGTRTDYDDLCRRFARRGYVALTIDYRLSPKHKWPAHIHDCKAAIRWLRAHAEEYRVDPERIAAMGSSAGGHLAQFLAVTNDVREFDGDHTHRDQSSRITCVAAWSQASDFTREYGIWKGAAEAFRGFLGDELTSETRRTHVRASPLFWVTPNAAPTLIIHGTLDQEVLFLQSVWIYEKLRSAEVDVELLPIEGGGHGLAGRHQEQAEQGMFRFFDRQFRIKRETEGVIAK